METRIEAPVALPLAAAMRRAQPIVREELSRAVAVGVYGTVGEAQKLVRVDTGTLRRSIVGDVRPFVGGVQGLVGSNQPHARGNEEGVPPGRWIPEGELLPWLRRKGIPADAEYPIRLKIFRRGIKAQPYLRPALARIAPRFRAEVAAVPGRVAARLGLTS